MNDRNRNPRAAEGELMDNDVSDIPDMGSLIAISRAEIDGQIATAKAYPRSVSAFRREGIELVTLDQDMAEACIYALPRDGKTIAGPSARFAEIIQHAFGNNRGGGRVVAEDGNFIVAQGTFHDLEKNVQVTMEVRRRITDKRGRKFKEDMISVTGNAAASIAHRNAVLKGIPKALWLPLYEAARSVAIGDVTTLVARRDKALGWFQKVGVTPEQVCEKVRVEGVDDIGLPELEIMTGLRTAIRDGARPEEIFAPDLPDAAENVSELAERVAQSRKGKAKQEPAKEPDPTPPTDPNAPPEIDPVALRRRILEAADLDALDSATADVSLLKPGAVREEIKALAAERRNEFTGEKA